jgi:hypothetical protein
MRNRRTGEASRALRAAPAKVADAGTSSNVRSPRARAPCWNRSPVVRRSRVPAPLRLLQAIAALALLMVPVSHWRYTSVGFDLRSHVGPDRVNRSYRLQWPGDGSVGILRERFRRPIFEPLDAFDVAVRVLQPPLRREPRSAWNRAGFWRVRSDALRGAESVRSVWVGVPSWLPAALLLLALPLARRGRRPAQ